MKLVDILLLGLTIAFLVIGIDQTIVLGFGKAYWAFMIALVAFFAFTLRKAKTPPPHTPDPRGTRPKKKK